jgi:2-dehydro-3-deoxygalactonokinase
MPVVLSGMVGSRQGWREAPYVPCPAGEAALAGGLLDIGEGRGTPVVIVPGVSVEHPSGMPDVMRGEETQIVGARAALPAAERFLLPGTHAKWARVRAGEVVSFRTYMAGEVFAALKDHTILARLMLESVGAPEAFLRGAREGANLSAGDLLHRLFGVRTHGLFGSLPGEALADYLSGLLIGAEIAAERKEGDQPVAIVGAAALAERYATALRQAGVETLLASDDSAAVGHYRIARAAGLL